MKFLKTPKSYDDKSFPELSSLTYRSRNEQGVKEIKVVYDKGIFILDKVTEYWIKPGLYWLNKETMIPAGAKKARVLDSYLRNSEKEWNDPTKWDMSTPFF